MPSTAVRSLDEIATYLGPTAGFTDDRATLHWPRSELAAARTVAVIWDDARRLVRVHAPFSLAAVGADHADPRALALAVAAVNRVLEIFGLELDAGARELAFVSHAFLDEDGCIATSVIDQLLTAVEMCETRVREGFAQLLQPSGGSA